MNKEELRKANEIKKEIDDLDRFVSVAEKVWKGKLNIKGILKSVPYWIYGAEEYELDTEMKNKVLQVLKDRQVELENKLNDI